MSENTDYLKVEQYKAYLQMKENFITRNFSTNKFFMIFIAVIYITLIWARDVDFGFGITSIIILSLFGMGLCFLWWTNIDTYGTIMGVKYKKVIDVIEKDLPFQVHAYEKEGIDELRKAKKAWLFADVQKAIALCAFLIFMVIFLIEFVPTVVLFVKG